MPWCIEDLHHTATSDIYLTLVSGANIASPEIEVAGNTVDAGANSRFDPDIAGLGDGRMIVVYTAPMALTTISTPVS